MLVSVVSYISLNGRLLVICLLSLPDCIFIDLLLIFVDCSMASNETTVSTKPVPTLSAGVDGDSSESDGETEPAKSFHRRFSTNKNIKSSV